MLAVSLLASVALAAEKREQVGTPFGLSFETHRFAVDEATGNIYINGGYTSVIHVLGPNGGAPSGGAPAELTDAEVPKKEPFGGGIAVDNACQYQKLSGSECEAFDPSNGDVYVAAGYEHAIDKFRLHEGKFEYVCQFVGWGFSGDACLKNVPTREAEPSEYEFNLPQGVAVDSDGNVYITDYGPPTSMMTAYEFDSSGKQVAKIVSKFPGRHEYFGQTGNVAVDGAGDVFMTPPPGGQVVEMKNLGSGSYEQQPLNAAAEGNALAVDMKDGRVFTISPEWQIVEYNTNLEYAAIVSGKNGVPYYPEGLAFDEATGHVMASGYSEEFAFQVFSFGSGPIIPDVGLGETEFTPRSITVHGFVNPDGTTVSKCEIELTSTNYLEGKHTFEEIQHCTVNAGSSPQPVSAEFKGLTPNETYIVHITATNENGTNRSPNVPYGRYLLTPAAPPVVKEVGLRSATRSTAVLTGVVNPENSETTYHFVFGKTSKYGGTTAPTAAGHYLNDQNVSTKVEGLEPGTKYHFALVAENPGGKATSSDVEFTTGGRLPPSVSNVTFEGLEPGAAVISGVVDTDSLPGSYEIEFGPDTSYATRAVGEVVERHERVTLNLIYLVPETTYHYKIVVRNEDGTAESADQTFTTPRYPLKIPQILPHVSALIAGFPTEQATFPKEPTATGKKQHKAKKHKAKKHKKHGKRKGAKKK